MASDYKICLMTSGSGAVASLDSLGTPVPDPQAPHLFYAERPRYGNGERRNQGAGNTEHLWPVLTAAQRTQLLVFCPTGDSGWVYVRSLGLDNAFHVYLALMVWPESEPLPQGGMYFDFKVKYEMMTAA